MSIDKVLRAFPSYPTSTEERMIDLTEKDDNVLLFPTKDKEALGGRGPTDPDNWLYSLPAGSKFLVQSKQQTADFSLGEFEIIAKKEEKPAVLLHSDLNQEIMSWVDSRRFCRMWSLFMVLRMGDEE